MSGPSPGRLIRNGLGPTTCWVEISRPNANSKDLPLLRPVNAFGLLPAIRGREAVLVRWWRPCPSTTELQVDTFRDGAPSSGLTEDEEPTGSRAPQSRRRRVEPFLTGWCSDRSGRYHRSVWPEGGSTAAVPEQALLIMRDRFR